jgi:hypothetical protein
MNIKPLNPEILIEEISIVLVGDFNPTIFHPMWFLHEDMIRESEAVDSKIDISHQDVTSFRLEWLTIQVLRERFTATIKADVYKKHLGDLVTNVFNKLFHTPIRQFGMNVSFRVRFKSMDDWHGFGHFLLPKSPWKDVFDQPGLHSCNVQGLRVDDKRPGCVILLVEPDIKTMSDVVIRVNDHYDIPVHGSDENKFPINAKWVVEIMREDFESSIARAHHYVDTLIKNYLQIQNVDNGVKK